MQNAPAGFDSRAARPDHASNILTKTLLGATYRGHHGSGFPWVHPRNHSRLRHSAPLHLSSLPVLLLPARSCLPPSSIWNARAVMENGKAKGEEEGEAEIRGPSAKMMHERNTRPPARQMSAFRPGYQGIQERAAKTTLETSSVRRPRC